MERPLKTYLRTFRRRWGLTQKELAFLVGAESPTTISRIEHLKRVPSLAMSLACLVVFDTTEYEMFPGLLADIREGVLNRAGELYDDLQGDPTPTARAKLDFLERVLGRSRDAKTEHV